MLRNVEVVYYHLAFGKKGSKPDPKHEEAIEKLLNGQFHSGMSHTIHYSTPFYVKSISYGGKPRLLYTLKRFEQKTYCIITEDLSEHDYLDSDTERSTSLRECLNDFKTSLANGKFIPIPKKEEKEEKEEEREDYFTDGKFIQFMPVQSGLISGPFPQYNYGAAGAGKTLTEIARLEQEFDEKHDVLYVTQRPELAATERHKRDRKYILSKENDAPNFAILDYVAMIKLIAPTLEEKKMLGEEEFNKWLGSYLGDRKRQAIPAAILSRQHQVYKELRNLSGYSEKEYFDKLGQKECLFHEKDEKEYLLQIYESYKSRLVQEGSYDPSFYEIKDFSLFEGHVVAIDEVDNLSTLQIHQLMRFANFKDIIVAGDGHQRDDDLLPKRPFIKRRLGDDCTDTSLDESKRCGKVIIEFANKLINAKYDVTGGQSEKGEYEEIKIPAGQHEGSFAWRDDWSDDEGVAMCQSLQEKYGKTDLYVITHPDFVEEARTKFPGNTVYTFQQSKGREFKHVVVYRPFDTDGFAAADDILASKDPGAKKTKRHLPKKGERDNLSFAPAFNQVFVGCTRAIESLTICQRDDKETHAVKNIIKRLRPAAASNKEKAVVKEEKKEEKIEIKVEKVEVKEDPEARLKKAIKLLMDGDEVQAKQEREYLSAGQRKKYDAFKREFDATRKREKEEEDERQKKRLEKIQREKEKKVIKKEEPEVKAVDTRGHKEIATSQNALLAMTTPRNDGAGAVASSLDASFASRSALPGHKERVQATSVAELKSPQLSVPQKSTAAQKKTPTSSSSSTPVAKKTAPPPKPTAWVPDPVEEWTRYFEQPDAFEKLFARDKKVSCLFVELIRNNETRKALEQMAASRPDLFRNVPIPHLFQKYLYLFAEAANGELPFICIVLAYPELANLAKVLLSNMNDETQEFFVSDLFKTYGIKRAGHISPNTIIYQLLTFEGIDVFLYLIDRYPLISRLISTKYLPQPVMTGRFPQVSLNMIDWLSGSEEGYTALTKLHEKNPEFLPGIPPELMFRFHKEVLSNGLEIETTAFNGLLDSQNDNYELLTDWLSNDTWIPHIINIYKTIPPEYLLRFTRQIIDPLLEHWYIDDEPPFLRLLISDPVFLSRLVDNGFFVVDQLQKTSTFALLATNPCFHPYLKKLFDDKPELFAQINFEEFFAGKKEVHGAGEFPVVMHLTCTKEGRQLLLSILKAQPDFLDHLASNKALFCVYHASYISVVPYLTCVYQSLVGTEEGNEIIELLKTRNPYLTPENISFEISNKGLDFIVGDEIDRVEQVKKDLTVENLAALMRDPQAKRLLFKSPGRLGARSLFSYMILNEEKDVVLLETLQQFPELITSVMHVNIFSVVLTLPDGRETSYLRTLLRTQTKCAIVQKLFEYKMFVDTIEPKALFEEMSDGVKLFEFLLRDLKLHWVLKKLFESDDFAYRFIKEFADRSLSEKGFASNTVTMMCRYYPVLVTNLADRAQQNRLKEVTPASLLFGNPKLVGPNFCFLAIHPAMHELLLSWVEADPTLPGRILAVQLGLALSAREADQPTVPLSCLAQTEAGRKFIRAYISDPVRAKSLANARMLSMLVMVEDCSDFVTNLIKANPDVIETLSKFTAQKILRRCLPDNELDLKSRLAKHVFRVEAQRRVAGLGATAGPGLDTDDAQIPTMDVSSDLEDVARLYNLQKILVAAGSAEILFRQDEKNECLFVRVSKEPHFARDLNEVFKSRPDLFKGGVPIKNLFHLYSNPHSLIKNGTIALISPMVLFPELHDLLMSMLSNLSEAEAARLVVELHKELKIQGLEKNITNLNQIAFRFPRLLLFLQEAYPAFAASFTISNMTAIRYIRASLEVSFLEAQSISTEGCEFFDRQMRLNSDIFANIPPEAMFRIYNASGDDKSSLLSTAFNNIAALQKEKSALLTRWLESDAWIDYIINMYSSKPHDYLVKFTLIVIADLLNYWRTSENPPMLRLLQKCPEFLYLIPKGALFSNSWVSNRMTAKHEKAPGVFELLCANPLYHPYLSDYMTWGNFKELDIKDFFESSDLDSGPNIPFNLSRTTNGLRVLNSILMLRPDILKRMASVEELFKMVKFPQARDGRPFTCLYKMLNQSAEGREILDLLRQANPALTPELLGRSLQNSGLNFLTDEEFAIVDDVRKNMNVDNLVRLMKRPDAYHLLFSTTGLDRYTSLIVDMLMVNSDALCKACERHPELIKIFPPDFLMFPIRFSTGGESGNYLLLAFDKPAACKFIKVLEPYDQYFARIDFAYIFNHGNKTTKVPYFEKILRDKDLHFLLFNMIKDEKKARDFAANYINVNLSEGAAFTMACKYCPEFVTLAVKVLPRIQPANLFFGIKEVVPSNFHWLARHLPAHEMLYKIFRSHSNLLARISQANLGRISAAPFPPDEPLSPLEALVQTQHGRNILLLIRNLSSQKKEMVEMIDKRLGEVADSMASASKGAGGTLAAMSPRK